MTHESVWHGFIATTIFPFVASGVEQELGSFQFLWLFLIGGLITSVLYVVVIWLLSFAFTSWYTLSKMLMSRGYSCVGGLDITFFTFLMIESLNGRGLYELTRYYLLLIPSRFGFGSIPREFYFVPFFIILAVALPFNSWFAHLFAAATGSLYYLGLLDALLLSPHTINALETAGILSWFCARPNFLVKPGTVQLPMPGAFRPEGYVVFSFTQTFKFSGILYYSSF
jgi:hypothetical protein